MLHPVPKGSFGAHAASPCSCHELLVLFLTPNRDPWWHPDPAQSLAEEFTVWDGDKHWLDQCWSDSFRQKVFCLCSSLCSSQHSTTIFHQSSLGYLMTHQNHSSWHGGEEEEMRPVCCWIWQAKRARKKKRACQRHRQCLWSVSPTEHVLYNPAQPHRGRIQLGPKSSSLARRWLKTASAYTQDFKKALHQRK